MSYEGTEQYLCTNGHQYFGPCTYEWSEHPNCPICQSPPAWCHSIDLTNGVELGEDDKPLPHCSAVDLEILTSEVTEICQCCGHERTVHHPTYKIPLAVGSVFK